MIIASIPNPRSAIMIALMLLIAFTTAAVAADNSQTTAPAESLSKADMLALKKQYQRPKNIPYPDDNPFSEAKAELGKSLFFDPRLSRSGVTSCATCHNPSLSWGDGNPRGVGFQHQQLDRKDPTTLNLAWDDLFFWDGRSNGLEAQATVPIQSVKEMNMPLDELTARLKSIHHYAPPFKAAFPNDPEPITSKNLSMAIATFERGIVSGPAPFDRWINGDEKAISRSARRGFVLFNKKANCAACHSGWRFSDGSFHDTGTDDPDIGRGKQLPNMLMMQHAFKTMGLRDIDRRGPYMHNGSLPTLMDVINHYDHGFIKRDSLAEEIKPLSLTEEEKTDLVEFLKTLTSEDAPTTLPTLPR